MISLYNLYGISQEHYEVIPPHYITRHSSANIPGNLVVKLLLPECQTIPSFTAARDDGGGD